MDQEEPRHSPAFSAALEAATGAIGEPTSALRVARFSVATWSRDGGSCVEMDDARGDGVIIFAASRPDDTSRVFGGETDPDAAAAARAARDALAWLGDPPPARIARVRPPVEGPGRSARRSGIVWCKPLFGEPTPWSDAMCDGDAWVMRDAGSVERALAIFVDPAQPHQGWVAATETAARSLMERAIAAARSAKVSGTDAGIDWDTLTVRPTKAGMPDDIVGIATAQLAAEGPRSMVVLVRRHAVVEAAFPGA